MGKIDIQSAIGMAIRIQRESVGMSQEGFAGHIGMHRTYLGAIERGERNPSLKNLEKVAEGLQISLSKLFTEAEKLATWKAK